MTFISIMFLLICLQTMAAEETQDIVRIGIYPLAGYNQVIDGNVSGYNYEYLHEIAEITGWKYEFVPLSDYEDGIKKLDHQEIDFLAPAQKTEEYLERYLYSDYSFGKGKHGAPFLSESGLDREILRAICSDICSSLIINI